MSDKHEFENAKCIRETDAALLIEVAELGDQLWIPKSAVHDDSEVYQKDDDGKLIVLAWWARKQDWYDGD